MRKINDLGISTISRGCEETVPRNTSSSPLTSAVNSSSFACTALIECWISVCFAFHSSEVSPHCKQACCNLTSETPSLEPSSYSKCRLLPLPLSCKGA